jgi:hypothetical protein
MEFVSGVSHISNSNGWHVENRRVSAYYFAHKFFETVDLGSPRPVKDVTELCLISFKRLLGFNNGSVLFVREE